jgi:lipopolysaccharide transport system ATP-binding protein
MRLAFAVAAHLEPEILVVDEVLAVGDAQFQAKCLNKMDDVTRHGRTVLFVSHNMFAVERLTTHGVVLQQGAVVFDGPTNNAITTYLESTGRAGMSDGDVENAPRPIPDLRQQIQFTRLDFADGRSEIEADEPIRLRLFARANGSVASIRFGATIFRADGSPVGCCFTPHVEAPPEGETGTYQLEFQQHRLAPGSYHFGLSAGRGDHLTGYTDYDILLDVLRFEIKPEEGAGGTISHWMPTWGPIRLNPPCLTKIT